MHLGVFLVYLSLLSTQLLKMEERLIELIENSIKNNWDRKAFTDFQGETLQYKDVGRKIAKIHLLLEAGGIVVDLFVGHHAPHDARAQRASHPSRPCRD